MVHFASGGFAPVNEMDERAAMAERHLFEWNKAVFGSFNPPFDAQG